MAKNVISETIRRAEILARLLNREIITKSEAAFYYNVEEITINRDLNFLRNLGLNISSRKGELKLFSQPSKDLLVNLSSEYICLKLNSELYKNSIKVFSKLNKDFFSYLILLSKAVSESLFIKIKYQRFYDNEIQQYELKPIRLVESNNNWLLHAVKKDEIILKTFYLSRMKEIVVTDKKFKLEKTPAELEKKYEIKLRFKPQVENEINYKIWFDEFEIEKDEKNFIILKTIQPITNKLAAWCISWWDAIEIISPKELKDYIKEIYYDFSKSNRMLGIKK
ncbi:MAG: WYL domain-containing transcriptional regulator [Ignavibacteriaceae bacterium]